MVSIDKVKRGVQTYLERELVPSMQGWQKWVFGAGAALILKRIDAVAQNIENNPLVKMMDVIHGDQIDLDAVYVAFREQAANSSAEILLPGMGVIRMGVADIDNLYRIILEA